MSKRPPLHLQQHVLAELGEDTVRTQNWRRPSGRSRTGGPDAGLDGNDSPISAKSSLQRAAPNGQPPKPMGPRQRRALARLVAAEVFDLMTARGIVGDDIVPRQGKEDGKWRGERS